MPFRFKKSESPAKAVRRVGRERVDAALGRLRKPDSPAAVHGVRKEIKKLRAIFRLVRAGIGRGAYRKGTKALREAADRLAAPRDAQVTLKAFQKLTGKRARQFADVEKALKKYARKEAQRFQKDKSVARAEQLLRKADRRMAGLKIKVSGWSAIEPGLKESYQRGRAAREMVLDKPLPENFHDWRKDVKNLWHYFCLLHPAWPAAARQQTDDLETMAAYLGDDHDLALLQQFIGEHRAEFNREATVLGRLIAARQKQLRVAALELGSQLYAESPAAFCRRLEDYWNAWR